MTFQLSTFFKWILNQYNLYNSLLVVTNMNFIVFIIDLLIDFGHAFLSEMFLPAVDILNEPVALALTAQVHQKHIEAKNQ